MYHYLYKTTNLINNKIYIGVHSSNKLNDSYMGSGIIIKRAINKYGISNFKKQILYRFTDIDSAYLCENIIVNNDFISRSDTYNLAIGGRGQYPGFKHSEEAKEKISELAQGRKHSKETKEKISKATTGKNNPFAGKTHTKESSAKMSAASKGKPKSTTHRENISKAAKRRKTIIVICPHCLKEGQNMAMKRWHFDKCKLNPSNFVQ